MTTTAIDMDRVRERFNELFIKKYGRLKRLPNITKRIPIPHLCPNDVNRQLMIKFKYNDMTEGEEKEFHEAIKKIIYKVMHKNGVMMDWEDVYQEIWKKIVKSKHTWQEWKGTMVSTWITIVANSVINTLHQSVNRYNSRFCLYDDLLSNTDGQDDSGNHSTCDSIAFELDEDSLSDNELKKLLWKEQFEEFREKLNDAEAYVFGIIVSMSNAILDAHDKRGRIPYKELREKTGYDESTFDLIIYNIKRKYCDTFNIKMPEQDSGGLDDGFLF